MKFQPESIPGQSTVPAEKPAYEQIAKIEAPKAHDAMKFLPFIGIKAE